MTELEALKKENERLLEELEDAEDEIQSLKWEMDALGEELDGSEDFELQLGAAESLAKKISDAMRMNLDCSKHLDDLIYKLTGRLQ